MSVKLIDRQNYSLIVRAKINAYLEQATVYPIQKNHPVKKAPVLGSVWLVNE
jgi:hypothetical protein